MTWTLLLALACGDKDDDAATDDSAVEGDADADTDSDTDTDTSPQSDATGEVETRDGVYSAQVEIKKAFSFYTGSKTFIYASSNEKATCADIASNMDNDSPQLDPSTIFEPGHCNLSVSVVGEPPVEAYDIQTDTGALVGINCAFGSGDWVQVGDTWYWDGDEWYEASAWKGDFAIAFHDQGAKQLLVDLDVREFEGTYPYGDPGEVKASGKISGSIYTEDCEGFEIQGGF